MNWKLQSIVAASVVSALVFATSAIADDGRLDLGFRADIGLGSGKPANDIIGYSLFGHYRLNDRWNVGFGVSYSPEFDFERTPEILGLATPEVFDAKGTSTELSGWVERVYRRPSGRSEWFWSAGLGFNSVDMKDVSGPLTGAGTFDITTDAGSEFLAMVGAGYRYWFGSGWGLEAAAHYDHHFADWKVADRISGRTGTVSDYSVRTLNMGFLKRF